MQCWGASGGWGCIDFEKKYKGGNGAFVSGILMLREKTKFYIYVGGRGDDGDCRDMSIYECERAIGGFNGGGNGGCDTTDNDSSGAGGGATDMRLLDDTSNSKELSLRSRIIVAAGGSGSAYNIYGSPGGDINGYIPIKSQSNEFKTSTTSQTNGNQFGVGSNGEDGNEVPGSGGGGGYFGGDAFGAQKGIENFFKAVSSSGSSFISGHPTCKAINNENDESPSDSSIHYSQIAFTNTLMINGFSLMPKPLKPFDYEIGHEGNGFLIITQLSSIFSYNCYKSKYFNFIALCSILVIIKY